MTFTIACGFVYVYYTWFREESGQCFVFGGGGVFGEC